MEGVKPFEFKQCVIITKSIGKSAKILKRLRTLVSSVSDRSISHHTHQHFLSGQTLEYTNDFALWAGESLGEKGLSEACRTSIPIRSPKSKRCGMTCQGDSGRLAAFPSLETPWPEKSSSSAMP